MKASVINIDRNNTTEPALAIVKKLSFNKIQPVFSDCSLEELQYFLNRAIAQEEYELCEHLKNLIDFRYTVCVA